MKKKMLLILIGIGSVTLVFSAFPFAGSYAQSQQKPIEIKLANYTPPAVILAYWLYEPWGFRLERITNGKVKFKYFHGGTLGTAKDSYDIAVSGIADISWSNINYMPGRFPKSEVFQLPFIPGEHGKRTSLALWKLFPKYFQDEYKDVKMLWIYCSPAAQLYTTKKQVKTVDDLKGMKLSVHPMQTSALKLLGATPVPLPVTEIYGALQKGVVDGCFTDNIMAKGFRLYEVCKYRTAMSFYTNPCPMIMNLKTYESLPDDVKAAFNAVSGTAGIDYNAATADFGDVRDGDFMRQKGMQFYTLPKAEREKAIRLVQPIYDEWTAKMESKGFAGKEILEQTREWIDKFECIDHEFWY
jgi:TRAP-type C4-dicarboxylate transport system substrate-binding protein